MDLRLHFLEAGAPLGDLRPAIATRVAATARAIEIAVAGRLATPAVDLLVVGTRRGTIPGLGIGGFCFEAARIEIQVDPSSPAAAASLADGSFDGVLAHEVHHALRWGGPGYGRTLGAALVSEGLADHFAAMVTGRPPAPWTQGLDADALGRVAALAAAERDGDYDHDRWFFGGGDLPDGAGYALGHALVGRYRAARPGSDPVTLARVPADMVLAVALDDVPRFAPAPGA